MPAKSMVMAAMSRVRRTREPLADTSMFSAALEPLKSMTSLPPWPSTVSLPSPGSHWKWSAPAPELRDVVAAVAVDEVVAGAAESACRRRRRRPACRRRRRRRCVRWVSVPMPFWPLIVSAPARPRTTRFSTALLLTSAGPGRERGDGGAVARDADGVGGVGAAVGGGVRALATVDGDGSASGEVDAGGHVVVPAERRDGDVVERRLAAGHGDLAPAPRDDVLAGVGADGDVVGGVGAVGDDGVGCAVAGAVEGVEVDVGAVEVGGAEVVDGDGVGAAERRGRSGPRCRRSPW